VKYLYFTFSSSDTISALCYVPPAQTLWISANSPSPIVYDPRSGINVTDFVGNDSTSGHSAAMFQLALKHLLFVPEVNEVLGVTNRKAITVWKYNPQAAITTLTGHSDLVECLCVCKNRLFCR
jgi:WD40 repeat protein